MRKFFNYVWRYFITGLLVILPLFLSLYILFILFRFADGILGRFVNIYLKKKFGFYIPGLGLILSLVIITIFGFLSTHFLGRYIYNLLDRIFKNFPLIRHIYPSIKNIFEFLFSKESLSFKKAVLVRYPTKESWTIGFVTNEGFKESIEKTRKDLLNVFVPLSPNPISGFLIFAPREDVIFLDISIEEAMKLIISGGMLNPTYISKRE
jgi:uncharacterized membrane protein